MGHLAGWQEGKGLSKSATDPPLCWLQLRVSMYLQVVRSRTWPWSHWSAPASPKMRGSVPSQCVLLSAV